MTKAYNTACYECDYLTPNHSAYYIMDTIGRISVERAKVGLTEFKQIRLFQCTKCHMIIPLEITE